MSRARRVEALEKVRVTLAVWKEAHKAYTSAQSYTGRLVLGEIEREAYTNFACAFKELGMIRRSKERTDDSTTHPLQSEV